MPSFRSSAVAVAVAFAAVTSADYVINPDSVPLGTRQAWCQNEKSTCPIICQQVEPRTTLVNDCDPATLTYGCLCGNNKRPNMTEYTLTLPFFVCQEWGNQCVAACGGNNACASSCRQDHPCGATDPVKQTSTAGTQTAKATASSTSSGNDENTIYTNSPGGNTQGSSGSSSNNANQPGAATAMEVGKAYGLAIVLGGLFAGFALL